MCTLLHYTYFILVHAHTVQTTDDKHSICTHFLYIFFMHVFLILVHTHTLHTM